MDSEGKVQKTYQYDAFGNEIQRSSEERYADNPESRLIYNSQIYDDAFGNYEVKEEKIQNRFGFAGEVYDPQVGLYYLRARFYNPVIGRFIQEDTYYRDGLNLYAYCHNNPVEYVDPSTSFLK